MNQNLTIPVTSLLPTFSDVLLAENPLAIIHKITGGLRPSRIRVEINDKLAKVIFKLSDEGTDDLLNGDTFCIVEKRSKKFGEITTAYKILNSAGYQVLRPFSMFDRFVLAVCISEWIKGNRYTTVAIIYRALTGKIGRSDAKPSITQRKAIIERALPTTGMWISTAVLLPIGILLTLKATTDSPLFDASSWRKFFEKHWPFGKKDTPK